MKDRNFSNNNEIWWFGENLPSWSNVVHGKISGKSIIASWADVPKGTIQSSGILVLKVVSDNRIEAVTRTGGFGGYVWTR